MVGAVSISPNIRFAADSPSVEIVHSWEGPRWPLLGKLAANLVIGPIFIHGIASRTLAGIKRATEIK